jgi:hypothetical protein
MSIGARSAIVWLMIWHSSYPHRDLVDAPHLIFCVLETSPASGLAACHGEARLNWRSPSELQIGDRAGG